MESLPKLLLSTLDHLCADKKLLQWNLQANGDTVYVNLRFVPPEYSDLGHASSPVPGLRRKSPSEQQRDFIRLSEWRQRNMSNQSTTQCSQKPGLSFYGKCNAENINVKDSVAPDEGMHTSQIRPQGGHAQQTVSDENNGDPISNDSVNVSTDDVTCEVKYPQTKTVTMDVNIAEYREPYIFDKFVEDSESKILAALLRDKAVVLYHYTKSNSENCDNIEIFDSDHRLYKKNLEAIEEMERVYPPAAERHHIYELILKKNSLQHMKLSDNIENG